MSEDEYPHRTGDEAMARRLKALACTAPLHQLDVRKTRLDRIDGTEYQMAEIALQAIDQVTIAMDFDRGADQEQVVRRLLPFIVAQCPGRPDAEYEQVAHWVLENLIRRGRLGDARLAAEQARYRTVQYAEMLRRQLEATRRDVRSVDWMTTIPDLLEEALAHIEARYRAENAIMSNIADARDEATDPDRRRRAAELVGIVSDCVRRHTQLQARLQEAGATFRAEQDRQQFTGAPQRAAIDLFGQLMTPCLRLDIATANGPTSTFFTAGAGLRLLSVVSLGGLVETLLLPPSDRDPLGEPIPEPDLAPLPDTDRFTDEQWRQAEALLELGEVPRRLSGLLAQSGAMDPELPELVALRVLHAVCPEVATARRQGEHSVPLAVDDGTVLDDPEFGGRDLLITLARVATAAGNEEVA
ncbi:MAG: hypothetical protein ACRDTC_10325 [Pseudonocardiaceae bacterium]